MEKKTVTISIIQLLEQFPNEDIAVEWLEKTRWGDKPICPHCGGTEHITKSKSQKYQYWHKDCRKRFTAKTDTIMHASPIEVRKWLVAMYYIMTDRKGISSLELSKQLGITQKSSWYMLQRIREACGGNGFMLANTVEIDETYLGGKEKNKHKSQRSKTKIGKSGKQPVIGMRERGGKTVAMSIKDTTAKTLQKIVRENVEKGSTVCTDDWGAYRGLVGDGSWPYEYNHKTVNHSAKEYVNGMIHTNGIESVWALLKRGYTGTFHHFSLKHLQRYLNEFTFRLNEGNVDIDTIDRIAAICKRVHGKRIAYKDLVA